VSHSERRNDLCGSSGVGGGRDSSVGIATRYGLDRLCRGREGGEIFLNPLSLELDIYSLSHHLCKM